MWLQTWKIHLCELKVSNTSKLKDDERSGKIINLTYRNGGRTSSKDISDKPSQAFYKGGKALTAFHPNWRDYTGEIQRIVSS